MRIDKIDVKPVQESINPELLFEIEYFYQRNYEIPIEITGSVFSDEKKKIADIHGLMHAPDQSFNLAAEHQKREEEDKRTIKLIAPLSQTLRRHTQPQQSCGA